MKSEILKYREENNSCVTDAKEQFHIKSILFPVSESILKQAIDKFEAYPKDMDEDDIYDFLSQNAYKIGSSAFPNKIFDRNWCLSFLMYDIHREQFYDYIIAQNKFIPGF